MKGALLLSKMVLIPFPVVETLALLDATLALIARWVLTYTHCKVGLCMQPQSGTLQTHSKGRQSHLLKRRKFLLQLLLTSGGPETPPPFTRPLGAFSWH